jgi:hypothetical protein
MNEDEFWNKVHAGARSLGIEDNTYYVWKSRGQVPAKWRIRLHHLTGIPLEKLEPQHGGQAA